MLFKCFSYVEIINFICVFCKFNIIDQKYFSRKCKNGACFGVRK